MININDDCREMKLVDIILNSYPKLKRYLFKNNYLSDNPNNLIKNSYSFSTGEKIIIKIILDIWDGSGNALFKDIYGVLDNKNFNNVIEVIKLKRRGIY